MLKRPHATVSDPLTDEASLLLSAVGHDLRSPLTTIRIGLDILRDSKGLSNEEKKLLRRMKKAIERSERLTGDLFEWAQVRFDVQPVKREPCDLFSIFQDIVSDMQMRYPSTELRVFSSGSTIGEWDPHRVAQIAENLLLNALQHGVLDTPIVVAIDGDVDLIEVTVHNEGSPIGDTIDAVLFEPMQRGTDAVAGSGLGLGLFIVRQLVFAHGGQIHVSSTQEGGTSFTIRLPRFCRSSSRRASSPLVANPRKKPQRSTRSSRRPP